MLHFSRWTELLTVSIWHVFFAYFSGFFSFSGYFVFFHGNYSFLYSFFRIVTKHNITVLSQQNGHIRSSSRMGKIHSWNIPCSCKSFFTVYDRISVRVGELLCITSKRIYLPQRFISHIRIDYMRFSLQSDREEDLVWESVYMTIEKRMMLYESQSTGMETRKFIVSPRY